MILNWSHDLTSSSSETLIWLDFVLSMAFLTCSYLSVVWSVTGTVCLVCCRCVTAS